MDDSNKPKRGEAREFWEAAIRLWSDSGLSVREFCSREGLADHSFYSWRRELLPEGLGSAASQDASATGDGAVTGDVRRRRQRKKVVAADKPEENVAASFIERVCWSSES